MQTAKILHWFYNFSFVLIFLSLFGFAQCGIAVISILQKNHFQDMRKRESSKVTIEVNENPFCVMTSDSNFGDKTEPLSQNVSCSDVPGPILKLNVGSGSYAKMENLQFIAPSDYCIIDRSNHGKLCPSHSKPLLRKCCPQNEILDSTSFKCRQSRKIYRPKTQATLHSFVAPTVRNETMDLLNFCPVGFVLKIYSTNPCLVHSAGKFHLATNGTPVYEISTGVFLRKTKFKPAEENYYCIDGLSNFSACTNGKWSGVRCQMESVMLVCLEEHETFLNEGDDEKGIPKAYFLTAIWLSTCPLLLSAAIANSCVIQKNVHGWLLTSYLISMFLVNINSVVMILDIGPPSEGCAVLDFTMKYIYMSTLCWLTSMNFGLFRTFSSTIPRVVGPQRFLISALFSLGFPLITVVVSFHAGSIPDTIDENLANEQDTGNETLSLPCHNKGICPLFSHKTFPYYHGPIIFLVLCNVAVFFKTSATIASLRRQAEAVLHKETKDSVESFTLFAKLFLLSGSIWVIRVVLLVLQIKGLYLTWYGVALEALFSIPEVVFPMIIFHHSEFIKWVWGKSPMISRILLKCNPFCKKDMFKEVNSLELQFGNQISVQKRMSQTTTGALIIDEES